MAGNTNTNTSTNTSGGRRSYTDSEIAEALAALELNGGNVKRTAVQLGIPRTSLLRWRDEVTTVSDTADTENRSHQFAGMWAEVMRLATERLRELIPAETDLRAVAVAAGIAADKHLDYTQGRKGAQTTVNQTNNTQLNVRVVYDDAE